MHGGGLVALEELRPTPGRGRMSNRDRREDGNADRIRYLITCPDAPVVAADRKGHDDSDQRAGQPAQQPVYDHLFYRRWARCDTCRLKQLRLYTPDRATRGTDIADVAVSHSIGGCFRVGGVLALCVYRNNIGRQTSDLNVVAELIERHSWTDIRQCVQEHRITTR